MMEWVVLGVVLIFSLRYLWRYIRRALGFGKQPTACSGCSAGSCHTEERQEVSLKPR